MCCANWERYGRRGVDVASAMTALAFSAARETTRLGVLFPARVPIITADTALVLSRSQRGLQHSRRYRASF